MFTGIVEGTGVVEQVFPRRLWIRLPWNASPGASIAINGVCLTVVRKRGTGAGAAGVKSRPFDVSPETLRCTNLGDLKPGCKVNLERPLAVSDRLGGHWVQGHVDATGRYVSVRRQKNSWWMEFTFPKNIARYIVKKGSVSVDGISLTVADLKRDRFAVAIIPHTWKLTNFHTRKIGDRVNLETDILAKYLERMMKR